MVDTVSLKSSKFFRRELAAIIRNDMFRQSRHGKYLTYSIDSLMHRSRSHSDNYRPLRISVNTNQEQRTLERTSIIDMDYLKYSGWPLPWLKWSKTVHSSKQVAQFVHQFLATTCNHGQCPSFYKYPGDHDVVRIVASLSTFQELPLAFLTGYNLPPL